MSKSKYSHFKLDDRLAIAELLAGNASFRKIAEKIGCAISSVSNEIRNRRILKGSLYFGDSARKLC
ncbi:MAG: helix-turn-helix domain-containing protein [Erysipelotrichaceae bacterium]|nr:helix-turn-helix domain-containing protein [Erysipelotrichaceae bacterium]